HLITGTAVASPARTIPAGTVSPWARVCIPIFLRRSHFAYFATTIREANIAHSGHQLVVGLGSQFRGLLSSLLFLRSFAVLPSTLNPQPTWRLELGAFPLSALISLFTCFYRQLRRNETRAPIPFHPDSHPFLCVRASRC